MGQPTDGDEAVPTSVVFHYALPSGTTRFDDPPDLVPGEYALRSASAAQVELVVTRPTREQLELVPATPLSPNTLYTLTARWKLPDGTEPDAALTFTTGDGPVDAAPEPPSAVIRSYQMTEDDSASCGPWRAASCVSVQDDQSLIEYTFIKEGAAMSSVLLRGSLLQPTARGMEQGRSFGCVELRRFGANGVRSQPLRLCGEEAPVSDLTDLTYMPDVHCSAAGLAWCDATGKSGSEPGPADPRGVDGALHCPLISETESSGSRQWVTASTASDDAGAAPEVAATPAAVSCNAVIASSKAPRGLSAFVLLASLCLLRARRRMARP